jgi:tetratricopeptide (TPR) repeat protein
VARLLVLLGTHEEAQTQYEQGIVLAEKLVTDFPDNAHYRHTLSDGYQQKGNTLSAQGLPARALEARLKAAEILQKLVTDFPLIRKYQSDLGHGYMMIGILFENNPAECLGWFDKAIATLEFITTLHRAGTSDPEDLVAQEIVHRSHCYRAQAYGQLHKHANEVKDWDRAIELTWEDRRPELRASRARAKLLAGRVAEAVTEVSELRQLPGWNGGQLYNFACIYSVASSKIADKKAEYAAAAIQLLQQAVTAGYKDHAHMKADKDLDPLRGRDDFKKLLADLEAKFPPKPEKK